MRCFRNKATSLDISRAVSCDIKQIQLSICESAYLQQGYRQIDPIDWYLWKQHRTSWSCFLFCSSSLFVFQWNTLVPRCVSKLLTGPVVPASFIFGLMWSMLNCRQTWLMAASKLSLQACVFWGTSHNWLTVGAICGTALNLPSGETPFFHEGGN